MAATRILLATAFCLFSDGVKAADPKMRVDAKVISATGMVSDEVSHKRKPMARRERHERDQFFTGSEGASPSFSDLAKITELGGDLKVAYEDIIAAVELFKAGSYTEGTNAIVDTAMTLLEKYGSLLPEQGANAVEQLKTSLARAQSIHSELANFRQTGDSEALAKALQDILKEVEAVAVATGNNKVVNVIKGFEQLIDGTAGYWGSVKNAEDPAAAVQGLYEAVKSSAILIIGEENIDEKMETLIAQLDETIGNLTSIVESYKREMEQKELCTKIYVPETSSPDVCPAGTALKYGRCMPSASALEGKFFGGVKKWWQASKPTCAAGLEKCGIKCRPAFPPGCTPKGCVCQISECPTTHPVDVKVPFVNVNVGVCAQNDGSVQAWGQELWTALGAVKAKFDTRPPTPDHAHFSSTIEAGLEALRQLIVPPCNKIPGTA